MQDLTPFVQIHERSESLVLSFRPHRVWPRLGFFAFWLTLWTLAGVAAFTALWHGPWGARAFLGVWLCMWAVAETAVTTIVAWQLFGREELLVKPDRLEVRHRIGPLARVKRVPVALVDSVRASGVDREGAAGVCCVEVSFGGTKIAVGAPLMQSEAENAASVVEGRVRPKPRWSDEPTAFGFGEDASPATDAVRFRGPWRYELGGIRCPPRTGATVFGAVVAAVAVALVLHDRHHGHIGSPPRRAAFSEPRAYAAAVTLYALGSGRTVLTGKPVCDQNSTWEHWTCRVTGPVRGGAYAGRELVYRCSARGDSIVCGLRNPPPLPVDRAGPPSRTAFSDPRVYAAAMTRFALTSGQTRFSGTPACDEHSTWERWTCRVTGRSAFGPYAGHPLIYRCSPSYEPQPGGRPVGGIICGPETPPPPTT